MALAVSIPSTSSSGGLGPFSLRLDTLVTPERLSLPPKVTSVSFMAQVSASQSPHPEVCCHQLFSGAFSREAGSGLSHQPGKPLVLRLSWGEMVPDTDRQGIWPSSGLLGTVALSKVSKMEALGRLFPPFPSPNCPCSMPSFDQIGNITSLYIV